MAENKVYRYYKDLPPWGKGVVITAGIGLLAFAAFKAYRLVFPSDEEKRNKKLATDINSEIKKHQSSGMQPSFQPSQYPIFANEIFTGLDSCWLDDYDLVEETMKKMKNDLDVALLIKAYDFRTTTCFFGLPETSDSKDLFSAVKRELANDWGFLDYRIKNINADWAAKKITYQL